MHVAPKISKERWKYLKSLPSHTEKWLCGGPRPEGPSNSRYPYRKAK